MHLTENVEFDRCVVVDFESYYDDELSITEMGYTRYIQNTHIYMVSVVNDSIQWVGDPEEFDWDRIKGYDFIAHNAAFDQHICDLRGWGEYRDFFCTADLCAFLQAPRSLAGAAKQLLNRSLNKKVRSGAKGRKWPEDFNAQQREDMLAYALADSVNSWDIFKKHIHEWPVFERKLSRITRLMGWRGVTVIREELEEAIETLKRAKHEKLTSLPWYGEIDPSTGKPYADMSNKALVYYCLREGVRPPSSRAKDSVEAQAWIKQHGDRLPWIQAMQDVGSINGQLTKVQAMLNRTVAAESSEGGHRMPYALKYYGAATTGRWSGDGGFNTQNITKGRHFGVDLRSLIRCLPGNALGIIDLSNIEPRCLYYLSGDQKPLELIRQGLDIYEAHARLTMGYDSDKPLKRPDTDPEQKKWGKFRDLAKVRVLQLGYGSGWHKLYLSARKFGQLHVFEEPYTDHERQEFISFVTKYNQKLVSELKKASSQDMLHYINAFRQVMDFRAKSPKITGFWNRMQEMLQEALGEDLIVTLPSGREMRYFNVRMGADGIECQTERGGNFYKFYGSKLVENCTQGIARDVFATALLRVVDTGIVPVLQVHDELVIEWECSKIAEVNKMVEDIFSTTPPWLGNTPLSSESQISEHYTK